jgi:phage shock protein A
MLSAVKQSISELIAERDDLRTQVDTLRAEALAWRKKAEDGQEHEAPERLVRVTIETNDPTVGEWLEALIIERQKLRQQVGRMQLRDLSGPNPYVCPED